MRVVITGGPCTGKTTVIEELASRGYDTIPEAAREIIEQALKNPKCLEDKTNLQRQIISKQLELESKLIYNNELIFLDRSGLDTLAYCKFFKIKAPLEFFSYASKTKFDKVYMFDQIGEFIYDGIRYEKPSDAERIHKLIHNVYVEHGYIPIKVSPISPKQRVDFILKNLGSDINRK